MISSNHKITYDRQMDFRQRRQHRIRILFVHLAVWTCFARINWTENWVRQNQLANEPKIDRRHPRPKPVHFYGHQERTKCLSGREPFTEAHTCLNATSSCITNQKPVLRKTADQRSIRVRTAQTILVDMSCWWAKRVSARHHQRPQVLQSVDLKTPNAKQHQTFLC